MSNETRQVYERANKQNSLTNTWTYPHSIYSRKGHWKPTRQESPERLAWQAFFRFAMKESFVVVVFTITFVEAAMLKENRKKKIEKFSVIILIRTADN
jgi:hypothetical protein